jgi:glucose/arabinose dehydrogenase
MATPRAPRLRLEQLEDRSVPAVMPGFAETTLATGLLQPTAMAVAPDGRIFVTEKGGNLRVVQPNGTVLSTPFLTVGVNTFSERGLIGVAFDPNFATNRFVYVYYTTNETVPVNRVSRFTADATNPNVAAAGSELILLDDIPSTNGNHNGGALVFRPDGKLYVAVGEAGVPANSQTLTNLLGKVLRINSDGTVPSDNPFVGVMGARPEIWALGLRNPFTMAVQPGTGTLHINDVGGGLFEEVNVGVAGANYGWPNTEGNFDPAAFPQFTQPLYAYAHGTGALQGNSIAGGAFYNPSSALFGQQFVGDYFFGEFVRSRIFVRDANTGAVSTFADGTAGGGVVDVDVLPDGRLLYLSLFTGSIVQITPAPPPTPNTSVIAAGSGGAVLALNADGGARFAARPFGAFAGSVRVATGDMNGDGIEDVVAVSGPGAPPMVVLYDGANGAEAGRFLAFDGRYSGGLNVTAGDVTGDGKADVIVSSVTGIAAVQVFDVAGARMVALFNAFPGYANGASVAAGDVDLDGRADIIAGTLVGVSGVRVFSGLTFAPIREFFAFGPVPVGVNVAFVNGEIVTGTATGQAFVRVFNAAGAERLTFAAAPPQFNTGITVAGLGNRLLAGVGGFAAAYDLTTGAFLASAVPFGGAGVFVG